MPEPAYANQVEVTSHTMKEGLRFDHPRLLEYIRNGIKLGWNNEHILQTVGREITPAMIDKERAKLKKA